MKLGEILLLLGLYLHLISFFILCIKAIFFFIHLHSEKQLLSRMSSLRTSYVRLSKPGKSGEAGKTLSSKNKWILSRMQFLAPHIKTRQSLTNFQVI